MILQRTFLLDYFQQLYLLDLFAFAYLFISSGKKLFKNKYTDY